MKYLWKTLLIVAVVSCAVAVPFATVSALAVPAPPNDTAILDEANIIDAATEAKLSQLLIDYKAKTGNEIAVLTVKSLQGEDDFSYSYKVAQTWGIGDKTANNGALLFVALDDRKVRIQVGRGLEPYLTDLQSSLIIRQKITPEFKAGKYSAGVESGVMSMIGVIGGERLSQSNSGVTTQTSQWLDLLGFLIFPIVYIFSFMARSKSWWLGGIAGATPGVVILFSSLAVGAAVLLVGVGLGLLLDYLLSKNYRDRMMSGDNTSWWGSGGGFFGGSGGSSGGFGGFGGGSFGGGGSGGSW